MLKCILAGSMKTESQLQDDHAFGSLFCTLKKIQTIYNSVQKNYANYSNCDEGN